MEAPDEEKDDETPEATVEDADEDDEDDEDDETTASVVKSHEGIEIVPTSQVIPPSLVDMVASTSVPRPRVLM